MPIRNVSIAATTSLAVSLALATPAVAVDEWSQWRGADRTSQVSDFEPPGEWPVALTTRWQMTVGRGDASPLVVGDRIYTWTRDGDDEVAAAWNGADGSKLWEGRVNNPFKPLQIVGEHGAGPYSTPAVMVGRLFTVGILGDVSAWDAQTGKQLWRRDFKDDFKFPRPFYGASQSPLVTDGKLIMSVGGPSGGALVAFDPENGRDLWRLELEGPSYGSGVVAEFGGERILVTPTRKRLIGVDLASGEQLWEFPFFVRQDTWSQTPLVVGDLILVSSGDGPSLGLEVKHEDGDWSVAERWSSNDFWLRYSSAVTIAGKIFAFADQKKGHLVAIDPGTGDLLWEGPGRQGETGWLLAAGDYLLVVYSEGRLDVFKTGEEVSQVASYDDITSSEIWAHPALVGQELIIKDKDTLQSFTLRP